ncbi:hypothetical protein G647_08573 [Cladophialophora carrionii CBS 160.54]|uniref:MAM domain-containing protein n=1 Tax=Cladophialophora carrionii CBS 160.54 TaxID=1279043 RepID=V9D1N0_9EURO|nr:uncharacterized protein G647_08573 [Cladophialophora carrionii CBS 160.54]ETI20536.1 hypothetical protein G647_08573 [Cladophialophora carrionii CBS 160.54]
MVEVVTDGGFEAAPNDDTLTTDITSGAWTVTGSAYFDFNGGPDGYQTPNGQKFVVFSGTNEVLPSVSQDITGLVAGELYSLNFDYSISYSSASNNGGASPCYLSFFLDGEGEPQLIGYLGPAQPAWASIWNVGFIPPCSDSTLVFSWDCSGLPDGTRIDFAIDNISLTGSKCGPAQPTITIP